MFIGPEFGVSPSDLWERLSPLRDSLVAALGVPDNADRPTNLFVKRLVIDTKDRANWDRAADWLKAEADRYEAALKDILGGKD